jgi:hypothetical protein
MVLVCGRIQSVLHRFTHAESIPYFCVIGTERHGLKPTRTKPLYPTGKPGGLYGLEL